MEEKRIVVLNENKHFMVLGLCSNSPAEEMYHRTNNESGMSYADTYSTRSDSHTTVTYRRNPGYFEKLGNSCCGVVVGLFLIIGSFPVLFLNEGRAVQTAHSLDEGLGSVVRINVNNDVDNTNCKKLIHLSGKLRTFQEISDPTYQINIHAVKVKRDVEMFQWIEHEQKREFNEGDRTRVEKTYSYSQEWRSSLVNSVGFSQSTTHRNPTEFPPPHTPHVFVQDDVTVGNFKLSKALIDNVNNFKKLNPREPQQGSNLKIVGQYYYLSDNPQRPMVGDVRVSFSYAGLSHPEQSSLQDMVSIIARQNGEKLDGFQTNAGDVLEILYLGEKTAEEIFTAEHSANTVLTWVLRFCGWILMFFGFQITMDIIRQIVSFIPIIREIVSLATSLIAFTLSVSLSLIIIAIGWLRYRPLLAVALFMGAAVPLFLSRRKASTEKNTKQTR